MTIDSSGVNPSLRDSHLYSKKHDFLTILLTNSCKTILDQGSDDLTVIKGHCALVNRIKLAPHLLEVAPPR